jgi:hypothetical protein
LRGGTVTQEIGGFSPPSAVSLGLFYIFSISFDRGWPAYSATPILFY